jgi:transposase-like protein
MVFEKGQLKELISSKGITDTAGLQELMREMYKEVIEGLMEAELTAHLGYPKHEPPEAPTGNSRNGKSKKSLNTSAGGVKISVPRDRNAEFEPQIVQKYQRDITGIEDKVISLYSKGMSTRDIQDHIHDIYGYDLSPESVSTITDGVLSMVKEWQSRPLEDTYAIVFIDGIRVKRRCNGVVDQSTVYIALGYDLDGRKSCLGMYVGESESSKYWLTVLNDLRNRGVKDVLIFACDNLTGISEAIHAAFPDAEIQKCIVHQIRNSLAFVPWTDRQKVAAELKAIYTAPTVDAGAAALEAFIASPFGKKYPYIGKSWKANWGELCTFFKFSQPLRRLMYTTNTIERFNCGLRKVSKTKQVFPTEDSVLKLFFLAQRDIMKTERFVKNWSQIRAELFVFYGDRIKAYE